jgi:hypothetical protein
MERSVTVQGGYQQQVLLRLEPVASSGGGAAQARGVGFFQQAVDAEIRQQGEVAEAGYLASQQQEPKLTAAYDRLASLYLRQGRNQEAVSQFLKPIARVPPTAHSYSELARAYGIFAQKGPGDRGSYRSAGLPPGDNADRKVGATLASARRQQRPEGRCYASLPHASRPERGGRPGAACGSGRCPGRPEFAGSTPRAGIRPRRRGSVLIAPTDPLPCLWFPYGFLVHTA